jgi:hypothetical protein
MVEFGDAPFPNPIERLTPASELLIARLDRSAADLTRLTDAASRDRKLLAMRTGTALWRANTYAPFRRIKRD